MTLGSNSKANRLKDRDPFASVWKRLWALLIDVVPITLMVFLVFYLGTDFRDTVHRYLDNPGDSEVRKQFLKERNVVRFISALIYLVYAAIMEATLLQATVGKKLMGMFVVDANGNRISFLTSFKRTFTKMFSILPAAIGCIAAFFHKHKQGWHDRIAGTFVLRRKWKPGDEESQ